MRKTWLTVAVVLFSFTLLAEEEEATAPETVETPAPIAAPVEPVPTAPVESAEPTPVVVAPVEVAPEIPVSLQNREGALLHVSGGIDLASATNFTGDNRITLTGSMGLDFFFSQKWGVFLGAGFVNRGFQRDSRQKKANFVDIPFGVVIRRVGDLFSDSSINFARLGGFIAIPTEHFSGPLETAISARSRTFYGVQLEGATVYRITDDIGVGPTLWIKLALSNPVVGYHTSLWFFHTGLGVQAVF